MKDTYRRAREVLSETDCLAELMRLRFGGSLPPCPACGRTGGFVPVPRLRSFTCEGCGHALRPCAGTPLEAPRTALADWFLAAALHAQNPARTSRALQQQAGLAKATADRMAADLTTLASPGTPFAGWIPALAAFVSQRAPDFATQAAKTTPPTAVMAPQAGGMGRPVDPAEPAAAAPPPSRRLRVVLLGLLGLVSVGAAGVFLLQEPAPVPVALVEEDDDTRYSPELSAAAPRPSLELAAVEEEVAGAKAVVDAVIAAETPAPAPQQAPPADRPSTPGAGPLPDRPSTGPVIQSTGDPNELITFGRLRVRRHLVELIVRASRVVGADPTLLMAIADKESSFSTAVKAQTSSATGLYQFIEQTWLGVLAEFGAKHGLQQEARLIVRAGRGFSIADPTERARILDLRREPYLAALMAGEMLKKDTLRIEQRLRRHLSAGEIYLIHFLGPDAAQQLMNAIDSSPTAVAALHFPKPAEANKSIFYANDRGKSVSEIRADFDKMMGQRLDKFREVRRVNTSVPAAPTR